MINTFKNIKACPAWTQTHYCSKKSAKNIHLKHSESWENKIYRFTRSTKSRFTSQSTGSDRTSLSASSISPRLRPLLWISCNRLHHLSFLGVMLSPHSPLSNRFNLMKAVKRIRLAKERLLNLQHTTIQTICHQPLNYWKTSKSWNHSSNTAN
jgi:hypothetical protein